MRCERRVRGRLQWTVSMVVMIRWAVMLVVAAACGADSTSSSAHVASLRLCALCDADSDCETGICREYGDGYRKCSNTCTAGEAASQCSAPSSEWCNNMGYCVCPQYQPPVDADTSGTYKDARMAPPDAGP
jgi:hypothetical protein